MTLEELKAEADSLGITYGPRIGEKALARRIDEFLLDDTPPDAEPVAEGIDAAPEAPTFTAPDPLETPAPADDEVTVRITKKGDGKVFDGKGGRYAWKQMVNLPLKSAKGLEDRGWAEIE